MTQYYQSHVEATYLVVLMRDKNHRMSQKKRKLKTQGTRRVSRVHKYNDVGFS